MTPPLTREAINELVRKGITQDFPVFYRIDKEYGEDDEDEWFTVKEVDGKVIDLQTGQEVEIDLSNLEFFAYAKRSS